MSILDKMMAKFKPAPAAPVDEPKPADAVAVVPDPQALADMTAKLEAYVYDPEVAAELAPAFVAMSAVDGFDKVLELLDAKEKQIEAISGNTPQQSSPQAVKPESVAKAPTATEILAARNKPAA